MKTIALFILSSALCAADTFYLYDVQIKDAASKLGVSWAKDSKLATNSIHPVSVSELLADEQTIVDVFVACRIDEKGIGNYDDTHDLEFVEETDQSGITFSKAKRKVGVVVSIEKTEDILTIDYSRTVLIRWLPLGNSKYFYPVFSHTGSTKAKLDAKAIKYDFIYPLGGSSDRFLFYKIEKSPNKAPEPTIMTHP